MSQVTHLKFLNLFIFAENLADVIIYSSPDDSKRKNRGFAFLEYASHKDASVAKRRIGNGRTRVWNCDIIVDWADPLEEPDEDTMAKVCPRTLLPSLWLPIVAGTNSTCTSNS